jgi:opacity protein-like surface antigen
MNTTRLFLSAALLTLAPLALADAPVSIPPPMNPFAKGTWTLQVEADYTAPIRYSDSDRYAGSVGVGYYLWDDVAATLTLRGFHANQDFDLDANGAELTLTGRAHFLHLFDDRMTLYVEGGGGYAWGDEAFPVGGTTYNFIARVGPGLTWRLSDHAHLNLGARYFHNSNAQQHGRDKNPGFDGVECYLGVIFTFR